MRPSALYFILFLSFACNTVTTCAQFEEELTKVWEVDEGADRLVVSHANGEREDAVTFTWERSNGGHDLLAYSRDGIFPQAKLVDVMRAAIGGYLDVQIKFGTEGVRCDLTPIVLAEEMQSMMNVLLTETRLATPNFKFSQVSQDALARLTRIDWSNTAYALEGNPDEDKYVAIFKFVRVQRESLERAIEKDLEAYSELWIGSDQVVVGNVSDETLCGTVFDEDNYLCALDLKVEEILVDDPQPGLALRLVSESQIIPQYIPSPPEKTEETSPVKVRKRDRWLQDELLRLNARMDKIDNTKEVLAIRDRIDVIEDRLSYIEDELEEVKAKPNEYDNPIENLSKLTGKHVTIRFQSGSTQVAPDYMVLLNEVFEHLARSPNQRILITGYSDKSGSAAKNLQLSEMRAKAVRAHLLERGISAERVLVNFYGDSKSTRVNVSERRVEIEWLRP